MRFYKLNDKETYNLDLIYKIVKNKYISNQDIIDKWDRDAKELHYKLKQDNKYTESDIYKNYQFRNYIGFYDTQTHIIKKIIISQLGERPEPEYKNSYICYLINKENFTLNEDQYNEICNWK